MTYKHISIRREPVRDCGSELNEMIRRYYDEADKLAEYRARLMERRRERPSPDELHSLDTRIDLLREEICDLRDTALCLKKLAADKPLTPSLAARRKGIS